MLLRVDADDAGATPRCRMRALLRYADKGTMNKRLDHADYMMILLILRCLRLLMLRGALLRLSRTSDTITRCYEHAARCCLLAFARYATIFISIRYATRCCRLRFYAIDYYYYRYALLLPLRQRLWRAVKILPLLLYGDCCQMPPLILMAYASATHKLSALFYIC